MAATLGHIVLNVEDFEESEHFYDQFIFMMGFELVEKKIKERAAYKTYNNGTQSICLKAEEGSRPQHHEANYLDHISFHVDRRIEVQRVYKIVQQTKAEIAWEPEEFTELGKTFYGFFFHDPNGIPIEIVVDVTS